MTNNTERDEMAIIADGEIGNECSHTGDMDESAPGSCGDCYKIAKDVAAALFAAGYRKVEGGADE